MRELPGEQCNESAAQRARGNVDRAPLRFIHDDHALERLEHGEQPGFEHRPHAALLSKREDGGGVAQRVDERGGVFAVGVVLGARQPDHRAIEADHGGHDDGEGANAGRADHRLDEPQRNHGPDEAHRAVQVDELTLREGGQRQRALLHAMGGLAGVMRLMPRKRQR